MVIVLIIAMLIFFALIFAGVWFAITRFEKTLKDRKNQFRNPLGPDIKGQTRELQGNTIKSAVRVANGPNVPKVTFNDIAGVDTAKEELQEIIDFLKDPSRFEKVGARIPKGVLLVGPPGCGKTLLARAVAGEAERPFFYTAGSEFVEVWVGMGASKVRELFEKAESYGPSIVFIDEIDAVGRHRGAGLGQSHDEREQTLNELFVQMDGFKKLPVVVIAATNRPDILDSALLRRLERKITVDLPDFKAREDILKIHVRGKPVELDVDLAKIARQTPGLSGDDLEKILNESAMLATRRKKETIGMKEVEDAVDRVTMGAESKNKKLTENERTITAYHESGHAIVGAKLSGADSPFKISILPRGMTGGHTKFLPEEDRHFLTKEQAVAQIAMALGGYAAEEIFSNAVTTGASNDIERATAIARKIVTEWGMGKLGPINVSTEKEHIFLGRDIAQSKNFSEATAQTIDQEVKEIIDEALEKARAIMNKNRKDVERLARALLEKETLTRPEIEEILAEKQNPSV